MANKRLDSQKRAMVLKALCEGMAINSACRVFSVGKHAVLRLIQEAGEACESWHHEHFRNLSVARLELDEQWSYCFKHKDKMGLIEARDHPERGDCWLWAGMDPDSKCIISWRTGKRTRTAYALAADLAMRVEGEVQITTDQHAAYVRPLSAAFGGRIHMAQELKEFRPLREPGNEWLLKKVNPLVRVKRSKVFGNPNLALSTISHLERFFLTMRQSNKRKARKTLAYSKRWDNHAFTTSIQIFTYNLCRVHESLKRTPAMEMGIVARRWSMDDVVSMTDAYWQAKETNTFEAAFAALSPRSMTSATIKGLELGAGGNDDYLP
ncbi:MAG: hypothetical protein U1A05_04420 [Alphaproteobacteria bacterium]|nr:hypothetical protein [Alphaproteobacteria bacterium]